MKRWHLLAIFAFALSIQGGAYIAWQSYAPQKPKLEEVKTVEVSRSPPKEVTRDGSNIAETAKKFVENQTSLGLAGLGGVAATLFAIIEKLRLTKWRQRWIVLAISFFSGSLFFGYVAMGAILRQLSEIGIPLVDTGDFHVASSLQFLTIIAGAFCYAALILDIINNPQRRSGTA
jgi:hypothetical protein